MKIYANWDTNTCGGHDLAAQTDAKGIAQIDLDSTITGLTLQIGGTISAEDPDDRGLTDAELHELFSKHKLTIRW